MQDSETKVHLDDAIDFVGECLDMCPEFERHEREYQNALADFEKIPGTNKVDHSRAVKRYRRSAAGDPEPMPCDVRPPYILVRTLDYLFHNVLREHGLEGSYAFVRDRARSIRTDFTLQNYRKMEAVECHERIARYHIICAFKFCNHATISLQQEQEQMRKTLQSLREYYKDLAVQGIFSPNEPEFQAYYILSHMWQSEIVTNAEVQLRPEVFSHPQVQLAIELQQLAQCGSDKRKTEMSGTMNFFSRFFRLIESQSTSYLIACLLHQEFVPIRRAALRVMHLKSHYSLGPYPIADLIQPLGLDDEEDVRYNLEYYGIDCEEIDGILVAAIGKDKRPGGRVNPIFNGIMFSYCWNMLTLCQMAKKEFRASYILPIG
ncbi:SAC3/GANP/Nin1/mts3/eIF-3 p25 family-domain-containing protein [Chytridium lagenaria]|nr:SAC3/GANP/Nin1/mts3/eIF-3 p25 family-domain-containing protein [Chytridium lagenaria]